MIERIGTMSPCCRIWRTPLPSVSTMHLVADAGLHVIDRDEARAGVLAVLVERLDDEQRAAGERRVLDRGPHRPDDAAAPHWRGVDPVDDADDRGIDRHEPRIARERGLARADEVDEVAVAGLHGVDRGLDVADRLAVLVDRLHEQDLLALEARAPCARRRPCP